MLIKGSDVLADICPKCGAFILVNNLLEDPYVYIEGFASEADMEQRMATLTADRS
jgi:hypothetical protein